MNYTNTNDDLEPFNWRNRLTELRGQALQIEIVALNHNQIIEWLQWNDCNGVYTDKESRREFGRIMSHKEGVEIMTRHIENPDYKRMIAFASKVTDDLSAIFNAKV